LRSTYDHYFLYSQP